MFTHLYVKSGYSLMQSTIKIDELITKAKENNQSMLALTDWHTMHGIIAFYKKCQQNHIKPIIGLTTKIEHEDGRIDSIVLLAENNKGYKNLIRLSTKLQMKDEKERKFFLSDLKDKKDGIIAILPLEESSVYFSIQSQQFQEVIRHFRLYESIFKEDNFYIGITDLPAMKEQHIDTIFKQLLVDYHFHPCALIDAVYLNEEDDYVYDCLIAMREKKIWEEKAFTKKHIKHFVTKEEAEEIFASWPKLIETTNAIGNRCNVDINFKKHMLPRYPLGDNEDANQFLKRLCFQQAEKKYNTLTPEIEQRLQHELNIIKEMDYSDYFLIVWDFIKFAKSKNIVVGPGRGSSAGSIVAYVLDITNVDPLTHNLLFERFLNPERLSMPDIDVDFEDIRRDEVIQYVKEKYGEEYVAQIATFGTFLARSIIRELFKTLDIAEDDQTYILKQMTKQGQKRIAQYVRDSTTLQNYVKRSKKLRLLFRIANRLEGLPRHVSTHAAGVIISKRKLVEDVPLMKGSQNIYLTQYTMDDLESIGLLKMDFLGLRNLTFLKNILQSIQTTKNIKIDLEKIPLDDYKTYKLLQHGLTNGIFQLESDGMKDVLRSLQPTSFEDIVAVNALYRPGPMNYIPTYIKRKKDQEKQFYFHEDLKYILQETYGVLVYQEQIMQIAHHVAKLSLGEADLLRRAISKKDKEAFNEKKEKFIKGCIENGYKKEEALQLFSWIMEFANYGFNKSHAVAYSQIAYQLSYLKANYPENFFEQIFNSLGKKENKLSIYKEEAKTFNIQLYPPHINKSNRLYRAENKKVFIGLEAIEGIDKNISKAIVNERNKNGPFKHLFDFCLRVDLNIVSRKAIENLILVGAFDEFSSNRKSHLQALDKALEQGELFKEFLGETNIFAHDLDTTLPNVKPFTTFEKLEKERELIGIYVSDHPLATYRKQLQKKGVLSIEAAKRGDFSSLLKGCVLIQSIRNIQTKKGKPMAFLTLEDETGEIEGVVFPKVYDQIKGLLLKEKIVYINGKVSIRNNQFQWIIQSMYPFTIELEKRLFIKIEENKDEYEALRFIKNLSEKSPGNIPIIIHNAKTKKTYRLANKFQINLADSILSDITKYFGEENVVLQ